MTQIKEFLINLEWWVLTINLKFVSICISDIFYWEITIIISTGKKMCKIKRQHMHTPLLLFDSFLSKKGEIVFSPVLKQNDWICVENSQQYYFILGIKSQYCYFLNHRWKSVSLQDMGTSKLEQGRALKSYTWIWKQTKWFAQHVNWV